MVDVPKTSFIPKQSMGSMPGRAPQKRRHFNVFNFIGIVVFLCGLIAAVGIYIYKGMVEEQLASRKAELQEIKNSFSQEDILSLRALDRRLSVARTLLDQHLAPSIVFDMLESRTQSDVQFIEFSYKRRPSGSVELVLNGDALRFNTVGLQSGGFANASELASAIFSDLNIDEEDTVKFTVTGETDVEALLYTATPADIPTEPLPEEGFEPPTEESTGTPVDIVDVGVPQDTNLIAPPTPMPTLEDFEQDFNAPSI